MNWGYFVAALINLFFIIANLHYALQVDKTAAMITLNGAAAGMCVIWFFRDLSKWFES